jgi:hypothetical protein
MTDNIDFGTCVHTFNDYSIYLLNDIYKFLKNVKIWKGLRTKNGKYSVDNREVDDNKVNEIYECILNNTLSPSIFQISEIYDSKERKFILRCWEGQHRWYALKKYLRDGHANRRYDINHLFVCFVYKNETDDSVRIKFRNYNKITPVPIDYDDNLELKIRRIELTKYLVDYIKGMYPTLQSTSDRPRKPNYNIDNLTFTLNNFIKDNELEYKTFSYMKDLISNTNLKLKEFYEDEYEKTKGNKPASVKKAFDYNCFLFLLDDFTSQLIITDESRTIIEV